MKKAVLLLAVIIVAGAALAQWYFMDRGRFTSEPVVEGLSRTVSENVLTSNHDPAVRLRFGPDYRHIGGQKFILYGVADTEQHFFIQTTEDGKLTSVYWIQFEAYLPDKQYTYDYDDSPLRIMLNDYEFYTDTAVGEFDPDLKRPRGTDGALARRFLAEQGYVLPTNFAYARLVYLTDESRRKELMIIFIDDLASRGFTAAALKEDGADVRHWPDVEQAHLDRIKDTLTVLPLDSK